VRGRQRLRDIENGTRRDAAAEQTGAQFFRILIDEDGLKEIMQLCPVLHPQRVRSEARISGQVHASQECAGRSKLTVAMVKNAPPRAFKVQKPINEITFDHIYDLIENPMPCC
jgi:hypothetical protein